MLKKIISGILITIRNTDITRGKTIRRVFVKHYAYSCFLLAISIMILSVILCMDVFAGTAIVPVLGSNKYKSVRLIPAVYNNANPDLSDILVVDGNGENIPYFINTSHLAVYKGTDQYPMSLINSYTKNDAFYFDYQVSNPPERDILATSIEVSTQADAFAKKVELYGSYDNINWEFFQSGVLYNVDGKSKLSIAFEKPQKYTHYRFKLDNNLEKISFQAVNLLYNFSTQEKSYFIENLTPEYTVEEKENTTRITIAGLKNLRLGEISIYTGSTFQRTVSTPFGISKELYNLSFNDSSFTDATIFFDQQISGDDEFVLTIYNGDDKPIDIKGLAVRYYADEIVFEDNGSEVYSLHFGSDGTKAAPVYDIVKYKGEILKGDIDSLSIREITIDVYAAGEPEQPDYKLVFNIAIILVSISLGASILFKLKKRG